MSLFYGSNILLHIPILTRTNHWQLCFYSNVSSSGVPFLDCSIERYFFERGGLEVAKRIRCNQHELTYLLWTYWCAYALGKIFPDGVSLLKIGIARQESFWIPFADLCLDKFVCNIEPDMFVNFLLWGINTRLFLVFVSIGVKKIHWRFSAFR